MPPGQVVHVKGPDQPCEPDQTENLTGLIKEKNQVVKNLRGLHSEQHNLNLRIAEAKTYLVNLEKDLDKVNDLYMKQNQVPEFTS